MLILLGVVVLAQGGDCPTCPRVELQRGEKQIVAVKTSPDEVSDIFVIEYLDLQSGALNLLDEQGGHAEVAGKAFWFDAHSRIGDNLKAGDFVWAIYNSDEQNDQDLPYLLELRPAQAGKPAHYELQRFLIYDPPPYQTKVFFGKDASALGHLAQVERARGLFENITLSSGSAKYDENEDRFIVSESGGKDPVVINQGKSRASGRLLEYDNNSGMAVLSGPIKLKRSGEKPLTGSADSLVYQVDDENLTLYGHVLLEQEDRTTKAASAVIVESRGYAYLYGSPVTSRGPDGELSGEVVRYNLNSGELLVLSGVKATFQNDGK